MSEKRYIKGINYKQGKYSGKMSVHVDTLIKELQELKNEKGYVNMELKERKDADRYNNTHYIVLDTWKPDNDRSSKVMKTEQTDLPW